MSNSSSSVSSDSEEFMSISSPGSGENSLMCWRGKVFSPGVLSQSISDSLSVESVPSTSSGRSLNNLNFFVNFKRFQWFNLKIFITNVLQLV